MVRFEKSRVDGYWICKDCGVAIIPSIEEINEHIENCLLGKKEVTE